MGPKVKGVGLVVAIAFAATIATAALAVSTAVTTQNVDVVKRTTSAVFLSNSAETNKVVIGVLLPPGAWVVTSDISVVNFGASDYVRCGVYAGNTALGGHTAKVGGASEVADIATMGAIKSASPIRISVRCSHDGVISGMYADGGASLWAHKSTSLTLPG